MPYERRRILVVDNHLETARRFEMLLQCDGHETRTEHDGSAALRALEEFKPEFIFFDVGMPGLNSYEIVEKLKDSDQRRRVCLVALTAWGDPSDLEQPRRAGFDLHLVKPVDVAGLRLLLEQPLNLR